MSAEYPRQQAGGIYGVERRHMTPISFFRDRYFMLQKAYALKYHHSPRNPMYAGFSEAYAHALTYLFIHTNLQTAAISIGQEKSNLDYRCLDGKANPKQWHMRGKLDEILLEIDRAEEHGQLPTPVEEILSDLQIPLTQITLYILSNL